MKKFIAWTLVLVLCLGMFAGCAEKPVESTPAGTTAGAEETNDGLEKAAKYLKALYITSPVETGVDYTRTTVVPVGTEKYNVSWAVDVAEDLVKIVAGEDNTVTVDVNEDNETETPYKLTATVTDAAGNKKEVVFDHILPKAALADGTELTVQEVIEMGAAKEHNTYTDFKYKVTGVITEVYNTQYGNMKITDDAGNILTIYGTFDADGTNRYDAMAVKPVAGDTVTIYGIVGQYNGTPQIKNGWITKHTPAGGNSGNTGNTGGTTTAPTLADALAAAAKLANDTYLDYVTTITGKISSLTEKDGKALAEGDTVTVSGHLSAYNGTPQFTYKDSATTVTLVTDGGGKSPAEADPNAPVLSVVSNPVVGTAYKFGMVNTNVSETDVYFITGDMAATYYFASSTDVSKALDVYLENAEGGYYLYTMINGAKTYINMVVSGAHVNAKYESAASTVYTYDAELQTLVATMSPEGKDTEPYYFGNYGSYTNVGTSATSKTGFCCKFYA